MRSMCVAAVLACQLPFMSLAAAEGVLVSMTFTAVGFTGRPPPPQTEVAGSFVYRAAKMTSPVRSLVAVDMLIDQHRYDVSEIDFSYHRFSNGRLEISFFGKASGGSAVNSGTDDFYFNLHPDFPSGPFVSPFYYASSSHRAAV